MCFPHSTRTSRVRGTPALAAWSIMQYIYARTLSIFSFDATFSASAQKSSASMPRLGMKVYSCMSRVQRVLSKS